MSKEKIGGRLFAIVVAVLLSAAALFLGVATQQAIADDVEGGTAETITVTIHASTREGELDEDYAPIVCDSVPKYSTYDEAMAYIKETEGSDFINLNNTGKYTLHAVWNTKKSFSKYASGDEAFNDRFQGSESLEEDTDVYIPYKILNYEINVEAPKCGTQVTDGHPGTTVTAPEGALWGGDIENKWIQGSNTPAGFSGTLEGGNTYYNYVFMKLPWGYASKSTSSVTVNGGQFVKNWVTGSYQGVECYGFFVSVDVEHDWKFKDITWTQDGDGYSAKANYVCADNQEHTASVDCDVNADASDPKKTVYTATVSAEDSLDGEEHTDEKIVYAVYNLYVQGVHVTGENCGNVLGDGTVSFDPEAVKLTLNNANIEMSRREYGFSEDKSEYGIRSNLPAKDSLPGSVAIEGLLTIELKGTNTIANNTPDTGTTDKCGMVFFTGGNTPVTFTGGGTLNISMTANESHSYRGIEFRESSTFDGVTVNVNIDGTVSNPTGVYQLYSNTIELKNRAQMHINVEKGYALDNNVQGNEDLSVAKGCIFEAVSQTGSAALHGNNWVKIAQATVDDLGVLVNGGPTSEGRSLWDGSTNLANYKYVYIPGKATLTLHWSSIDGVDLMDPVEIPVDPGTTFLNALKQKYPEAETTIEAIVFEKEGYEDWFVKTLKPMTEYADERALFDDDLDEDFLIQTDTDVYCSMFAIIPEAKVTVTPPVCGTTTETPDKTYPYNSQTNPPEFTVDTEHVYIDRSDGRLPGHWLTDSESTNHIFEGAFKGGESYFADMKITADYGYCFDEDLELTLSGADFEKLFIAAESYHFFAKVEAVHDWGEWKVVKEAAVGVTGLETRSCKHCGEIETREIPALDAITHVITFDPAGGTVYNSSDPVSREYEEGKTITMPTPTRAGYRFLYWEEPKCYAGDEYTVVEDHSFTAAWEKLPATGGKSATKMPVTGDPTTPVWLAVLVAGAGSIALSWGMYLKKY